MKMQRTAILILVACILIVATAIGCKCNERARSVRETEVQQSASPNAMDATAPGDSVVLGFVPQDVSRESNRVQAESPGQSEPADVNGPTIWLDYSEIWLQPLTA
jgi:hypothetical protein